MKLINFRGLNCYLNCIVTVAASLGVDYLSSFATLWSETDFTYDPISRVYLTKRMISNLEALGAKLEALNCSSENDREKSLSQFPAGECIIVGMDAFHIPWNQYYHRLCGIHHFIARKGQDGSLSCFDPTYSQQDMRITPEEIVSYAFDMKRLRKVAKRPFHIEGTREAREILRTHPETREILLRKIGGCTGAKQKDADMLAKYIDAMIRNRYLYRHYLQNRPSASEGDWQLFSDEFFLRWTAVKNGLYKAFLIRPNESVLLEVCRQFRGLIDEEIAAAGKMIKAAPAC